MGKASSRKARRRVKEAALAREIIEQGLDTEPKGRPVKPHRSGGGLTVDMLVIDEYVGPKRV